MSFEIAYKQQLTQFKSRVCKPLYEMFICYGALEMPPEVTDSLEEFLHSREIKRLVIPTTLSFTQSDSVNSAHFDDRDQGR